MQIQSRIEKVVLIQWEFRVIYFFSYLARVPAKIKKVRTRFAFISFQPPHAIATCYFFFFLSFFSSNPHRSFSFFFLFYFKICHIFQPKRPKLNLRRASKKLQALKKLLQNKNMFEVNENGKSGKKNKTNVIILNWYLTLFHLVF